MSVFERIKKWQDSSICLILYDLQKMFNVPCKMEIYGHACESGVWINIRIKYNGKEYGANGSRPDIVKKRLVELIDRLQIRDDFI